MHECASLTVPAPCHSRRAGLDGGAAGQCAPEASPARPSAAPGISNAPSKPQDAALAADAALKPDVFLDSHVVLNDRGVIVKVKCQDPDHHTQMFEHIRAKLVDDSSTAKSVRQKASAVAKLVEGSPLLKVELASSAPKLDRVFNLEITFPLAACDVGRTDWSNASLGHGESDGVHVHLTVLNGAKFEAVDGKLRVSATLSSFCWIFFWDLLHSWEYPGKGGVVNAHLAAVLLGLGNVRQLYAFLYYSRDDKPLHPLPMDQHGNFDHYGLHIYGSKRLSQCQVQGFAWNPVECPNFIVKYGGVMKQLLFVRHGGDDDSAGSPVYYAAATPEWPYEIQLVDGFDKIYISPEGFKTVSLHVTLHVKLKYSSSLEDVAQLWPRFSPEVCPCGREKCPSNGTMVFRCGGCGRSMCQEGLKEGLTVRCCIVPLPIRCCVDCYKRCVLTSIFDSRAHASCCELSGRSLLETT